MAITINGSGITSSEIADGTITSTKITDGTIVNADINSSAAIDASKLTGTGKVLQVVHAGDYTSTINSSPSQNTWYDTVVTASITPQSTTSRMFVITTFGLYGYNTSGDYGISNRIKRTIGGTSTNPTNLTFHNPTGTNYHATIYENSSEGSDIQHRIKTLQALDEAHSTSSQITYTVQMGAYNINQLYLGAPYNSRWSMTLMEIEQ